MKHNTEGCFHLHIRNGKITDGFSHLSNFPKDCVLHLTPTEVFSNEEFLETHYPDRDELRSLGNNKIYDLVERNFKVLEEKVMIANKNNFIELLESINGVIELTEAELNVMRTNPEFCYEVLEENFGSEKALMFTNYLFEGFGMEKGKSLLDQALSFTSTIKDKKHKADVISAIAVEIASTGDFDKAVSVARSIQDPKIKEQTISTISIEVSKDNPEAALTIANSISDPEEKAYAYISIAGNMISDDIKLSKKKK